jgi:hypothetical protein
MFGGVIISAAVEGIVDEAVIRKLVIYTGASPGSIYGKNGKPDIRLKVQGYNKAAQRNPWIVLVDLDNDAQCAPTLHAAWLPHPERFMCFRVAVREVEAWLLADREQMASFLAVGCDRIPHDPESLADAKEALVNLARKSRRKEIREDMVPRAGSGREVGPAYASRVIEFVSRHWRPDEASLKAESLSRAIECLKRLVIGQQGRESQVSDM